MDGSAPPTSSDLTAMPENAKENTTCDEDILEEKRPAEKAEQPLSQEKTEANIQLPKFLGTVVRAASSTAQQAATGCGCAANGPPENAANADDITISITPTTGGQFDLTVERGESVENLKKIISRKLKVAKERICLLHRERLLRDGTLEENRLRDGSRLTLLPSVETGLLAQRPEQSVMQALESLNDSQVNDFLSGKAPLNLTMRLGDHMMLIQLQLSTVTPTSPTTSQSSSSNTDLNIGVNPSTGTNMPSALSNLLQSRRSTVLAARSTSSTSKIQNGSSRTASMISSLVSAIHATANCSTSLSTATTTTSPVCSSRATTASSVSSSTYSQIGSGFCNGQGQQSPRPGHNSSSNSPTSASSSSSPSPPSATGNNTACQSCLLYHHHHHHHHHHNHHHHHHHHHHSRNKAAAAAAVTAAAAAAAAACSLGNINPASSSNPGNGVQQQQQQSTSEAPLDPPPPKKKLCTAHHHQSNSTEGSRSTSVEETRPQSPGASSSVEQSSKAASLDTRALVEASRNLTQKLKQLSSEENARRRHGAIIESMHHHGKGVYSGTFSGTLNPALQDRHGRPKRDISTIIHILNDLLCATPAATVGHYRHHHRHSSSRQHSLTSTSSTATATSTTGTSANLGCHDSNGSGYSTEELSKENEATKGKMRRLRLVMEQRRAQRRARQARQARAAPYTTQWAAVTPDPDPNHDPNTSTTSPGAATANPAEPQTEPELQPCSPEPVVA